jgi:LytS/YehU family sensor histidine kinase
VLWFLCGILHLYLIADVFPQVLSAILPERFTANTQRTRSASFFMAVLATNKGSLFATAMALVLKFSKYLYLKEQRNLQLQKENAEAQLKLLTAQVHPHFLFNTLNNIYSQTQTESPKGSKMILDLSDMLRYVLAEGSKAQVPLEKELRMIQDYINLEKVRYGNKLDLHLSLPDETKGLYIAPLLLLPFLENSFKHGASNFLTEPWINLTIELKGNQLFLKLMNGKDDNYSHLIPKSGTGIPNVKERLRLLYPDKHELQISDEKDVFVINLRLQLNDIRPELTTLNQTEQVSYA